MAEVSTAARRTPQGPPLPLEVEGLLPALARARAGEEGALEEWHRARYPVLVRACARWARSRDLGERVAHRVLVAAWVASLRGAAVRRERAWLGKVALCERAKIRRLDRASGLPRSRELLPAGEPVSQEIDPSERMLRRDLAEHAMSLVGALPPPHREIATLQAASWTRPQILALLRRWQPVGDDEFLRLVGISHAMLTAAGRGDDLRERWPGRFDTKKNRWLTSPPPPVRGHA
jgi:DNA-directed RNA polymerase specialized sigma24 family protein